MSDSKSLTGELAARTKYGENPWQSNSGLYSNPDNDDSLAIPKFELQQGSLPSYNNYADVDRLLQTMTHLAAGMKTNGFDVPQIALGAKHGNMCGAAVNDSEFSAIEDMLAGDPRAIFGGAVMLNFGLNLDTATTLLRHDMPGEQKRLLDIVAATSADKEGLEAMQRKEGKLRVLTNQALGHLSVASIDHEERFRHVRGGFLAQENYSHILELDSFEYEGTEALTPEERRDLVLAWAVGATSNSNTITLVKDGKLIGNGVGQQDRVSAANLALARANGSNHKTTGAVAYSDSFFPFPDGPQVLVEAGIKAVLTSSGSIRDNEVRETFAQAGVKVVMAPDSEIRGFYAH